MTARFAVQLEITDGLEYVWWLVDLGTEPLTRVLSSPVVDRMQHYAGRLARRDREQGT